jgi:hypothetical protein
MIHFFGISNPYRKPIINPSEPKLDEGLKIMEEMGKFVGVFLYLKNTSFYPSKISTTSYQLS